LASTFNYVNPSLVVVVVSPVLSTLRLLRTSQESRTLFDMHLPSARSGLSRSLSPLELLTLMLLSKTLSVE
jgi:hypothetical protein